MGKIQKRNYLCLTERTNQGYVLHYFDQSEASFYRNHVCPRSGQVSVPCVLMLWEVYSMTKHSENWSGNTLLWSVFIVHIWVWPLPPTGGCRSMLHLEIISFASLRWKNVLWSKSYTFSRITSFVNTGAAEICIAKDVTHSSHLTAGTQNFAETSELSAIS